MLSSVSKSSGKGSFRHLCCFYIWISNSAAGMMDLTTTKKHVFKVVGCPVHDESIGHWRSPFITGKNANGCNL